MTRYNALRRTVVIVMAAYVVLAPGCSWQKIPPPPAYEPVEPIPLIVGIELEEAAPSQTLGSEVVGQLSDMNIFQYLIWPYSTKTPVDGVLELSIDGAWKESKGQTVTSAIFVGLTLGLLGPFLGTTTTGTHHVTASLIQSETPVVEYDFHVEIKVKRGLSASRDVTMFQAEQLQSRKIAVGLAERLNGDRRKITGEEPVQPDEQK